VDRHLAVNEKRETTVPFTSIKEQVIKFIQRYYPERLVEVITQLYDHKHLFVIKDSLNKYQGAIFLDEHFFKELEKNHKPIYSFIGKRMYVRGSINIIAAPPGGGKSLFLLSEAMYQAAVNNYKVLLTVVGDMDEYAVFRRESKIFEKMSLGLNQEEKTKLAEKLNKNLEICIEKYGAITSFTLAKHVENSDYDFVIIDYDDNLVLFKDSMLYVEAAQPYVDMDRVKDNRVIIFASQGKPSSWKEKSDLSIGFLASSSRKEHIADSIYVMKPEKKTDKKFWSLFVLKDRHGLNGAGKTLAMLTLADGTVNVQQVEE
jgi:hypothetical protein